MRKLIIRILKKLIRDLSKKKLKEFSSYHEAIEFCESKTKGAYESKIFCKYRFESTENFLDTGGNILDSPKIQIFLFGILYFMKKNNGKCPKIIDYGGACGLSIKLLEEVFGEEIYSNSWIIESPQQVKESREWRFSSKLQFISDLNKVIKSNSIDIFFSSGTIQYLENPYKPLEIVADSQIPIVVLTRNNFSDKSYIFAQETILSGNSLGDSIKKYGDPKIYYPNTPINKKKLINIFEKRGYTILLDKKSNNGVVGKSNYGGDLILLKSF